MDEKILPRLIGRNEAEPLSSLNHFTVPVAISTSTAFVHCVFAEVLRGNNCGRRTLLGRA
jgi:hypothetical protein